MNLLRAIGGFLLSFVFLFIFLNIIIGVQSFSENYLKKPNGELFLGSISDSLQKSAPTSVTSNFVPLDVIPDINAKSAISIESDLRGVHKILFDKGSDLALPIASLTKLMTAVVVLDNYRLSDIVTVSKEADLQDPMKQDVKFGDVMSVEDFLDIMIVGSSNRSAYALSEGPGGYMGYTRFVELMNKKARDIGLKNTFFVDPTGLSSENISTAADLATLAENILKNYPKVANISKVKQFYVPGFGNVINTNQLLSEVPDVICSKTGFTTEAKGCLLLVINNTKNGNYLINVILGADDRFSEMKKLIKLCE